MLARLRVMVEWIGVGVAVGAAAFVVAYEVVHCFWGAR